MPRVETFEAVPEIPEQQTDSETTAEESEVEVPESSQEQAEALAEGKEAEGELQTQIDDLKRQLAKERNDNKALKGNRRRQSDLEDALAEMKAELSGLSKHNQVLIKALTTGQADDVPAQLQSVQRETDVSRQRALFERTASSTMEELASLVTDDDGNAILDLNRAPELEAARVAYNEAVAAYKEGRYSTAGLQRAVVEASKAVSLVLRRTARETKMAAEKAAKEAAKKAREKALEDAEVYDLDTGGGSAGGGNESLEALAAKDTRRMTPKELREHEKALDAAMRQGG